MYQQFKYQRSLDKLSVMQHGVSMTAIRRMIIKEAANGIAEHCLAESDMQVTTVESDIVFSMSLEMVPRRDYDAEVEKVRMANARIAALESHVRMLQNQINNVKSYVNANL